MEKILIAWIIIACEVGFWIFVLAGLIARYVFNQRKLGNLLLICTPIVDLLLLVATVIDLKNGAVATTVHGIAAIYIGVSIAFGHRMIAWADVRFAYYFRNGPKPDKKKKNMEVNMQKLKEKAGSAIYYPGLLVVALFSQLFIILIIILRRNSFSISFVSGLLF